MKKETKRKPINGLYELESKKEFEVIVMGVLLVVLVAIVLIGVALL